MTSSQTSGAASELQASVAPIRNWPLTLLSGMLLPLLLGLGLWQLQRAEEKAQLNAAIDARLSAQPQQPAELEGMQAYTPVRLPGYYREEVRYLDNRTRNGRVGYEILQVFVSGKQRWLVNRGWVPGGADREQLPEVPWPREAKVITGFLYPLDDTGEAPAGPRVQRANRALGEELELAQPDWSVRLSADSDTALLTGWQLVNSPPQRHTAYAVQWFAMAAALLLLWLFAATDLPQKLRKKYRARPQANSD